MITKTRQDWTPGSTVKVEFLSLIVRAAIATPGDHKPDAYVLHNAAGTKHYKFTPHHGLESIGPVEAQSLCAEQEEAAARASYRAMEAASAQQRQAAELKASILMWRSFGESAHGRAKANAASKLLYALTGEVLVKGSFVRPDFA